MSVSISFAGPRFVTQRGTGIRTLPELMGRSDIPTTMNDLHQFDRPGAGAPSPLDLQRAGLWFADYTEPQTIHAAMT